MLAGLVRAGLAAAEREVVNAGGRPVEVVRLTITDDGRKALKE
jgi:capsid protein